MGKSTFARALIDFRPENVPEPFWFSFYENQDVKLGDILEKLAAYMKAPEITTFKLESREPGKIDVDNLIGELNNMSEIWIFFDDLSIILEDTKFSDKGIELLFSSLRYNTHEAKIIITSRILPKLENGESLIDVVEGEEKHHLNGLRTDFAVDYLVKNGLGSLELDKLKELVDGVDGHPLALKLLVELVKDYSVGDVLEDLSLYKEQTKDTILKARKLFEKLAGDEIGLLERISVYREPVGMKGLKKMFTETTAQNAVKNLIDKSLLETDHKGNYWLHSLVQEFSYDGLDNKKEVHKLAMDYYLSLPISKKPAKKEDIQPLIEAYHHACVAEEYDQAFHIIDNNLHKYLNLWGNYTALVDLCSKILSKNQFGEESFLKDKRDHRTILEILGMAYYYLGQSRKSIEYCEQALKINKEIGDICGICGKCGEKTELSTLGNVYCDLGEYTKAIEYHKQALKISKVTKDRKGESIAFANLGSAYSGLGEYTKAIEYCEQALKINKEIGDRHVEGSSLGILGSVYYDMKEYAKAIEYYEKALKIAQDTGDRGTEEICLEKLGIVYIVLGEYTKTIEYCEQALKINKATENRNGESIAFANLGSAYSGLGEYTKAIEYCEQALKINKEIGDRHVEGSSLGILGSAYNGLGEYTKAIEYCEQALKINKEIGDRQEESIALASLGFAYRSLSEYAKAIEYYEKALKITQDTGDRGTEEICLGNIGIAHRELGEYAKAIEYYEKALKIAQDIGDRQGGGTSLGNLGNVYHDMKEYTKAIEYYEKALEINPEAPNTYYNKACTQSLMNKKNEALTDLKSAIELDPKYKEYAKKDKDFENLWDTRNFKDIITSNKEN
ncbi:tetratricopeptide repeat protein [Methanosarcina sp. UBA5]|uniref:tetratricopeptide repeat protein n=1 Tax=Methanosarcina sp. UBA5 TaxID=1915593 RepID=UPI0025FE0463|nr:tetratricopeptide repeat protein [Methanosarcina sp. UBA5]